jgi:SAM-dependent methyltransferase
MIARTLRRMFSGVSWKNPIIASAIRMLNPVDWLVRLSSGLLDLPKYSVRVRSNGLRSQFGGAKFSQEGKYLQALLTTHTNLQTDSRVLEIGCGCGRTALALADVLANGGYKGMDIERISLEACMRNRVFTRKDFQFEIMDVYNREYNPKGFSAADTYRFPIDDGCFDVIFLISVFTHMLPSEVAHYVSEIYRMLKSGGRCLFSTFLVDDGTEGQSIKFPYRLGEAYIYKRIFPEIAVGYSLDFFLKNFKRHDMCLSTRPLIGQWRGIKGPQPVIDFSQDILVFQKS